MQITEVRISPYKSGTDSYLKAFATLVFDNSLVVEGFKILKTPRGIFVAMPSRKTSSGDYRDVVYSITTELNDTIQKSILRAWEDELARPENN